eukprot:COSAG02_NODE_44760_length_363_cov_0.784091_1_plen_56_part_01
MFVDTLGLHGVRWAIQAHDWADRKDGRLGVLRQGHAVHSTLARDHRQRLYLVSMWR